jgi:hypothetical protein
MDIGSSETTLTGTQPSLEEIRQYSRTLKDALDTYDTIQTNLSSLRRQLLMFDIDPNVGRNARPAFTRDELVEQHVKTTVRDLNLLTQGLSRLTGGMVPHVAREISAVLVQLFEECAYYNLTADMWEQNQSPRISKKFFDDTRETVNMARNFAIRTEDDIYTYIFDNKLQDCVVYDWEAIVSMPTSKIVWS